MALPEGCHHPEELGASPLGPHSTLPITTSIFHPLLFTCLLFAQAPR